VEHGRPAPYPDSKPHIVDDTGVRPDLGWTTGTPRWVKVFGIIALVAVVLVVIMLLTGGHGPGRHTSGGLGGHTPPSSGTDNGVPKP
jgi:hypothetical protein